MKAVKLLFVFVFLCLANDCLATSQIFNHVPVAINTTTTVFHQIYGATANNATETNRQILSGISGNITYLRIHLSVAPNNGAGTQSVTGTIRINGASSTAACTISETAQDCIFTGSVAVTAGDKLGLQETVANTPAASNISFSIVIKGNNNNEINFGSGSSATSLPTIGSTTLYFAPNLVGLSTTTTETGVQMVMPVNATIDQLYFAVAVAPQNGAGTQSWAATLRKDTGSGLTNTALTTTISEAATSNSDLTDSVSVNAGDLLTISIVPANSPAINSKGFVGMRVTTPNNEQYIVSAEFNTNLSTSTTQYSNFWGPSINNGEDSSSQPFLNTQVKNIYVALTTAPNNGAGTQSYAFQLRNGYTNVSNTVTISETSTSGNFSATDDVDTLDLLDTMITPSGTPTASQASISYLLINPLTTLEASTMEAATIN